MSSEDIYDKSRWPLQTPDLFWALTDTLEDIGSLETHDENFAEYVIDSEDLPEGSLALNSVNAIRNIKVNILDFPKPLQLKIKAFALCLDSNTLEFLPVDRGAIYSEFSMFSKQNILPLFALDAHKLLVRVFFEDLDSDESALLPYKCVNCDGLLVRIKSTSKPFFLGASSQCIVSWTGSQCKVISSGCPDNESTPKQERKLEEPRAPMKRHRCIEPQCLETLTNYKDLWSALPLSPSLISARYKMKPEETSETERPVFNPEDSSEDESPFNLF